MIMMDRARKNLSKIRDNFCRGVLGKWDLPDIKKLSGPTEEDLKKESTFKPPVDPQDIERVLSRYGVSATYSDYHIGSSVTTYEISVPIGTKFARITQYRDDIARDLEAPSLRIIQSLSDSSKIGFEIENKDRFMVYFKEAYKHLPEGLELPVVMGEDTYGEAVYEDLSKMPHLLVAGQTGAGKSVFLNTTISSLICNKGPAELQFLIVDPKQVEFVSFEDLPHLMRKIASDPQEAYDLLDMATQEMERRFKLLRENRVKKITDYNSKTDHPLPYIVFIVDEFADLMLMGTSKQRKEVESKIVRIAQKARAVGIHMILATQKPLATIVTSLIKANMPARVAFSVTSGYDSRVILDEIGAEVLTGCGDMLYRDPNARSEYTRLRRIQAPWISDEDLDMLVRG